MAIITYRMIKAILSLTINCYSFQINNAILFICAYTLSPTFKSSYWADLRVIRDNIGTDSAINRTVIWVYPS